MTWTNTNPLPDGHTLFFTDSLKYPELVAIADESGATPEQTDDGVLWLDFERPLMAGTTDDGEGRISSYCAIPLKTPDGEQTRTGTDIPTLVLLASWFHWPVNCRGVIFNIERRNAMGKVVPLALVVDELDGAGMLEAATLITNKFSGNDD